MCEVNIMNGLVCKMCGYIAIDGEAPEKCPVCEAAKTAFEEQDVIKTSESEGTTEKHVPVITVVKECGLLGEGCTDVHVKVGDTPHPMEEDHYIVFVDFYVDKKFVGRVHLTPDCNPAGCLHLKAGSGKITAIEFCNLHGYWISETDL